MRLAEIRLELNGAAENGHSISVTLQTNERHAKLRVAIDGIRRKLEKLTEGLFGGGTVVLFEAQAAEQQPAFGSIWVVGGETIDQRHCFRVLAFGKQLSGAIRPGFKADARGRDLRSVRLPAGMLI